MQIISISDRPDKTEEVRRYDLNNLLSLGLRANENLSIFDLSRTERVSLNAKGYFFRVISGAVKIFSRFPSHVGVNRNGARWISGSPYLATGTFAQFSAGQLVFSAWGKSNTRVVVYQALQREKVKPGRFLISNVNEESRGNGIVLQSLVPVTDLQSQLGYEVVRLKPGQIVPAHEHSAFLSVVIVRRGQGWCGLEAQEGQQEITKVRRGTVIRIDPGVNHSFRSTKHLDGLAFDSVQLLSPIGSHYTFTQREFWS